MWYIIPIAFIIFTIFTLFTLSFVGKTLLKGKFNAEVERMFATLSHEGAEEPAPVELSTLPAPVQRWLEAAGVLSSLGECSVRKVHLRQEAEMRLSPAGRWMKLRAEQYFRVDEPGFIWHARISVLPLIHIGARDILFREEGNMLIKMLSLFTLADASGEKLSQSSLHRFLAELTWFPQGAASPYLQWESVDSRTADATISCKGHEVCGRFHFDDEGLPYRFTAWRYMEKNGSYRIYPWQADMSNFQTMGGVRIPTRAEVRWVLPQEEFYWLNLKITEIDYS